MATCTVNGATYEARTGLKTWGELLDGLEQGEGAARIVVTGVRFDGVEEPSFREGPMLARGLESSQAIDVETCAVGELVASTITVAREGLGPLADAARETADKFRNRDLAGANQELAELAVTLKTLGNITAAVRDQTMVLSSAGSQGLGTDFFTELGRALESLVEASTSQDWILVADLLEYEMPPLLVRWNELLSSLADSYEPPVPI